MIPYRPRSTERLESINIGDWALKSYSIVQGEASLDRSRFGPGITLALAALPSPAITAERLGVGFVIQHQGNGIDYIVLCWWDRENELPIRVFVRERANDNGWRPARGSESVCVWDLEVIAAERQAYVDTVLSGAPDRERYLRT